MSFPGFNINANGRFIKADGSFMMPMCRRMEPSAKWPLDLSRGLPIPYDPTQARTEVSLPGQKQVLHAF